MEEAHILSHSIWMCVCVCVCQHQNMTLPNLIPLVNLQSSYMFATLVNRRQKADESIY